MGIHPCSDVFVLATVTYRDAHGLKVVQYSCEDKQSDPTARILGRQIRWSTGNVQRAVVILPETGDHLFFPEPVEANHCPPEEAIAAYLRGESVERVQQMCHAESAPSAGK